VSKYWCNNCHHLLPLKDNERTENFKEWWEKNREQFKLMHLEGDCNTNKNQIQKVEKV
jgi:hypothetical protein